MGVPSTLAGAIDDTDAAAASERRVRHAVIRVIGEHLRDSSRVSWQGYDFDFSNAVFDGGDLSHANFSGGKVSFAWATFVSGFMNFDHAKFTGGEVFFIGTAFSGGMVSFTRAKFARGKVSFSGWAEFSSGRVSFDMARFTGGRASFVGSGFSGCDVSFILAEFTGGEVDLSRPRSWDVPPRFELPDRMPEGLLLPDGWLPPPNVPTQRDQDVAAELDTFSELMYFHRDPRRSQGPVEP